MRLNKKYIMIAAVTLAVVVGTLWFSGILRPKTEESKDNKAEQEAGALNFERSSYEAALERAKAWRVDAELSRASVSGGETRFIFSSDTLRDKGFAVTVSGGKISGAGETPFVSSGGELPTDIMSSEEAIAKARSVPGYESATILSVDIIYGPDGGVWYWGVKTDKGVVTVKATP